MSQRGDDERTGEGRRSGGGERLVDNRRDLLTRERKTMEVYLFRQRDLLRV